jgi:hypothetical protein
MAEFADPARPKWDGYDHYNAAMESEWWQDKVAQALLGILVTLNQINARYQEASRGHR